MSDLPDRLMRQRRSAARQQQQQRKNREPGGKTSCPECHSETPSTYDGFRAHVRADGPSHAKLQSESDIESAFRQITLKNQTPLAANHDLTPHSSASAPSNSPRRRNAAGSSEAPKDSEKYMSPDASDVSHSDFRQQSPPDSTKQERRSSPQTSSSRTRRGHSQSPYDATKRRHVTSQRKIWNPDDDSSHKIGTSLLKSPEKARPTSAKMNGPPPGSAAENDQSRASVGSPDIRNISQEQLIAEVKGIYAALVMVESKCIDTHGQKLVDPIDNGQYRALIALHRTLLHEHHDFFLASQHPTASVTLQRLAAKYAMPARMWRHGIHSFLEFLRHRLPDSREFMMTYIYIAYQSMGLLYETVPSFQDTWIECLGDLSRYRMAIEDKDPRDREIWTEVSRHWYSKASARAPTTGRLYHHLAILARPHTLTQLFYYNKALCVVTTFASAQESIKTLFEPLMDDETRTDSFDGLFVRVQGGLFMGEDQDQLSTWHHLVLEKMDGHIAKTGKKWLESGYFTGISLACSILGFGVHEKFPMQVILPLIKQTENKNIEMKGPQAAETEANGNPEQDSRVDLAKNIKLASLEASVGFAMQAWAIAIKRFGDMNTLSFHHTMLVFLLHLTRFPDVLELFEAQVPWTLIAELLNYLLQQTKYRPPPLRKTDDEIDFTAPEGDQQRPLPDDYALRGLVYTQDYLPEKCFPDNVEEEEKYFEKSSMNEERIMRIVWLCSRIARSGRWLTWDPTIGQGDGQLRGEFGAGTTFSGTIISHDEMEDQVANDVDKS